ncbi:class I SAM-dependent methyltransferase [Candidatus Woesearchaeota archaeon]|nr:class I SAM-dependent methyltransferase [Candidatus Woesearchaeota archaeon]
MDKIKEAINAYNKIADLYAYYNYNKLLQFQLNKFISLLPGKKVLDAGCGPGRDVSYFMDEGIDVTGIDASLGMINAAKKRVERGKFFLMDFRNIKFDDESFDGIWCMAGLANLPREYLDNVMKEFHRVLNNKGVIYLAIKEGKGEETVKRARYNEEPIPYVYYSLHEIEQSLKELDFTIIESGVTDDEDERWIEIFAIKSNEETENKE